MSSTTSSSSKASSDLDCNGRPGTKHTTATSLTVSKRKFSDMEIGAGEAFLTNHLRAAAESGSIRDPDHHDMKKKLLLQAAEGDKRVMSDISEIFFTVHALRELVSKLESKAEKKKTVGNDVLQSKCRLERRLREAETRVRWPKVGKQDKGSEVEKGLQQSESQNELNIEPFLSIPPRSNEEHPRIKRRKSTGEDFRPTLQLNAVTSPHEDLQVSDQCERKEDPQRRSKSGRSLSAPPDTGWALHTVHAGRVSKVSTTASTLPPNLTGPDVLKKPGYQNVGVGSAVLYKNTKFLNAKSQQIATARTKDEVGKIEEAIREWRNDIKQMARDAPKPNTGRKPGYEEKPRQLRPSRRLTSFVTNQQRLSFIRELASKKNIAKKFPMLSTREDGPWRAGHEGLNSKFAKAVKLTHTSLPKKLGATKRFEAFMKKLSQRKLPNGGVKNVENNGCPKTFAPTAGAVRQIPDGRWTFERP